MNKVSYPVLVTASTAAIAAIVYSAAGLVAAEMFAAGALFGAVALSWWSKRSV